MARTTLLTLVEAAAVIGTSPDNLRGRIKGGTLRATKRGRDWFVAQAEVDRYIAHNRRVPR